LKNGKATISSRLNVALFCAEYGWTYERYLNEPMWLVDVLVMKMVEDSKRQKSQMRNK
jgi:hypothetical protein